MYIKNLVREFKIWSEVKKTLLENIGSINKLGFDVDWVGRLYTVIELPKEINELPQNNINEIIERNLAVDLYVKNQLGDISNLLTELRLSDLIMYPDEYTQFKGSESILLILSPDRKYFTLFKFTSFLVGVAAVVTSVVVFISWLLTR